LSFFESEVVRAEIAEIGELQEDLYSDIFSFGEMNKEQQVEHVISLEKLLDKQRVLYTRLSLSDDPEAKKMKDNIRESAAMMGLSKDVDMNVVFSQMRDMLKLMKEHIEGPI